MRRSWRPSCGCGFQGAAGPGARQHGLAGRGHRLCFQPVDRDPDGREVPSRCACDGLSAAGMEGAAGDSTRPDAHLRGAGAGARQANGGAGGGNRLWRESSGDCRSCHRVVGADGSLAGYRWGWSASANCWTRSSDSRTMRSFLAARSWRNVWTSWTGTARRRACPITDLLDHLSFFAQSTKIRLD